MVHEQVPWADLSPVLHDWWQQGHSWASMADTINRRYGTTITAATVQNRWQRLSDTQPPYRLPARRATTEHYDDTDLKKALHATNRALGRPVTHPVTINEYDQYRDRHRNTMPSSIAIRRKYGTWRHACDTAGVATNEPRRTYTGLTSDDVVVWLAHWLRDLRATGTTPTASVTRYRLWVHDHPDAPSYDTIRNLGVFTDLLEDAAHLEHTTRRLPTPTPVRSGPTKTPPRTLDLPN